MPRKTIRTKLLRRSFAGRKSPRRSRCQEAATDVYESATPQRGGFELSFETSAAEPPGRRLLRQIRAGPGSEAIKLFRRDTYVGIGRLARYQDSDSAACSVTSADTSRARSSPTATSRDI